jgi:hypothetical protein
MDFSRRKKAWDQHRSWEEAECAWDRQANAAAKSHPLKVLSHDPQMVGITEDTARHLKWKSLKWIIGKDKGRKIAGYLLKNPFLYLFRYLRSIFKKKSFVRKGDFFLYGLDSLEQFEKSLASPDRILILGFSYCHKPFECPSGRFTDQCLHDPDHPVCKQCFIGKCVHAAPSATTIPLYIPTVHYIGEKVFEVQERHPGKEIMFLITACELTLTMFGDWGNLAGIQGIGVRLGGRICNTMKAFELSEEGIKPGLTVVAEETKNKMLAWLRQARTVSKGC